MKVLIVLFLLLFVVGCSTFTREQCDKMDWKKVGFNEALKGSTEDQGLKYYGKHCTSKHEVSVDKARYLEGYKLGFVKYCTKSEAYKRGARGDSNALSCPEDSKEIVFRHFRQGRLRYLENEVIKLTNRIRTLETENSNLKSENARLQSENSSLRLK